MQPARSAKWRCKLRRQRRTPERRSSSLSSERVFAPDHIVSATDNERVGPGDDQGFLAWIRQRVQKMPQAIDPRPPFVIGFDNNPGRERGVGLTEDRFLGPRVFIPPRDRRIIVCRQFPML